MAASPEASTPAASPLASLALFRFGARECTFREVLGWAEFTGRLEQTLQRLRQTERALASGEKIPRRRLQQGTTEFRYRNNLITVAETQAWLDERTLTLDQLLRHLYRQFCHGEADAAPSVDEWYAGVPDVFAELWAELHFAGEFDVLVEDFLFRVAAEADPGAGNSTRAGSLNLNASKFSRLLLEGLLDDVRRLEGAYVQYAERVATPETCQRRLKSHRLELLRVEYQMLTYADAHRAREACCCLRDDGEDPEELADRTGVLIRTTSAFVGDLPADVGPKLVSAEPGEVLQPIQLPRQNEYLVCRLLRKIEPELASVEVLARVKRRLIAETLSPEVERKLRWLPWRPGGAP
jgi:hypothetical protein